MRKLLAPALLALSLSSPAFASAPSEAALPSLEPLGPAKASCPSGSSGGCLLSSGSFPIGPLACAARRQAAISLVRSSIAPLRSSGTPASLPASMGEIMLSLAARVMPVAAR